LDGEQGAVNRGAFGDGEAGKVRGEEFHAARAAFFQDGNSLLRGLNLHGAGICWIDRAAGEAGGFERVDDTAHGWRANLLGAGEFAEGKRAAKDDNGKRGEAGGSDAGGGVVHADEAEEVDRGTVKAVGEIFGLNVSGHSLAWLIIFLTRYAEADY
jgi:hypothetical protein